MEAESAGGQHRITSHPVLDIPDHPAMVEFTFEGRRLRGRDAEMISSALFANGIQCFGQHPRDGSPQGIFCANGQCSQCLVLADGIPVKACVTALRPDMDVLPLSALPTLKADDQPVRGRGDTPKVETDVLIIGGGPAGLTAAIELGQHRVPTILCDDKATLGGKLGLQTHNFFGSVRDCYAGQRGLEIGRRLEHDARAAESLDVWLDSPVVGVFCDGYVGVVRQGRFTLVRPKRMLIAAGAREKMLAFPGADLPGVYGAGAFQTLVNRDLIRPSQRLFIVGGGNVGLIVAYQALQAGIDVVGLVEVLPQCGGYKVHLDKIRRLGVPVFPSHTVVRAEGTARVERVIVAPVDAELRPRPGTERVFDVDTVLIAVGLAPVNELFEEGRRAGIGVYAAGDAHEIAEASAAMFSGKIIARTILKEMGFPVEVPEEWRSTQAMLSSHPGPIIGSYPPPEGKPVYPIIRCPQEIPCNPCTEACITGGIVIPEGNLLGRPRLVGDCVGCLKCLAVCPGLAISLVDRRHDPSERFARVTLAWEMPEGLVKPGMDVPTTGADGEPIGSARVVRVLSGKALNRRRMLVVDVPTAEADRVAGIRIRTPGEGAPVGLLTQPSDSDVIVCRCERITKDAVREYIQATGARDINAIKAGLRCGMGPCGGKTCGDLIGQVFRELGIPRAEIQPPVRRPFTQEVPLRSFLEEGTDEAGA
ncbi:MAG TPA: FAD-dependent oxidoreductase [Thermoplasmata archaeon]|nr:FAD-dependent oxidoreductase [Thermoplasmata archaeon]